MERVKDFLIKKIYSLSKDKIRDSALPLDKHNDESLFNLLREIINSEEAWRENKLYLENELALKTEEIAKCNRALATQQYDDLQLLGERDEKIQHLENKLSRLTAALDDDERIKEIVYKHADIWTAQAAINDYRAMLKGEMEK